jgi:photosystem II stability/assembly factor-like uncharacterized protein
MKKLIFIVLCLIQFPNFSQQKIEIINETKGLSLRGLSVVSDEIFWVSGNKGTVGKSINGGKTIEWMTVKGFEKSDFRDIEAFDKNTAIVIAIAEPAYILKTIDGGATWKTVFKNETKGMFLDAMDFDKHKNGIVVGDAVAGKIFLASTNDKGETWQEIENQPIAISQEGCFASSGTNIILHKNKFHFVTGGKNSRYFNNKNPLTIPIIQGSESTGANSIAVSKNGKDIIIVGGDFNSKNDTTDNCLVSNDGGNTFIKSSKKPTGYRSSVIFLDKKRAITCGLNGIDISHDKGANWLNISNEGFHACQKAAKGKVIYFSGSNGRIGRMTDFK